MTFLAFFVLCAVCQKGLLCKLRGRAPRPTREGLGFRVWVYIGVHRDVRRV